MSDPLTDPRAHDLLAAEPGEVQSLASQFRRVAAQAETASAGLRGAHGDATWTGGSADAFRAKVGKLPGDLLKVQQSYGDAANALTSYGSQIGPLKSQLRSLVSQLESAQTALSTAQGNLTTARSTLTSAAQAPMAKPSSPSVVSANQAVSTAGGALSAAQGNVSGLDRRAFQILDEFDSLRGRARSAISHAAGLAPQDNSNWFSGALSGIGHFVSGAGHFVADMAVGVYKAATSLPSDIANVYNHPGDLQAWSKLAGDVGKVAGAVALVAAVIVCPLDAVGLEGAAAFLATTDTVAGAVATGAGVDKTLWDGTLAAQGKGSWSTVLSDGVSVAAGGVKVPGLRASGAATTGLEDTTKALGQYSAARGSGMTATQAYSSLTATQRSLIASSAVSLTRNRGLTTLISSTEAAAKASRVVEHRFDAGNEFAHTVFDGAKDKVAPTPGD